MISVNLIENVNHLIFEELGVSCAVSNETDKIVNELIDLFGETERQIIDNGVSLKQGTYQTILFKTLKNKPLKLTLNWKVYNFTNRSYRELYFKKNNIKQPKNLIKDSGWSVWRENKYSDNNIGFADVVTFSIGSQINKKSLIDTVAHELHHLYEQTMMDKSYGNSESNECYTTAALNLQNTDILERRIANLIYICSRNEINAVINGMVNSVLSQLTNESDINKLINQSFAFSQLNKAVDFSHYIKNNKTDKIERTLSKYGFNVGSFNMFIDKSIKYFKWKFARAIVKIKQDFFKSQGVNLSGNPFYFYSLSPNLNYNEIK